MGGQITATATPLYHSRFKEMTVERATNWADMKYELLPNLHNISGQRDLCACLRLHAHSFKKSGTKKDGAKRGWITIQLNL